MANPTSAFGWQMPTSTDLVTDLPADFEVFGQAVDTSLADLKGGTTGQVLSKATNADMDFTWVTSDDANAIQNAIVDAKGDLIAATAADTPARLAVGANDLVLTAASGESTGLKWAGQVQTWTPTWTNFTTGNGTLDYAKYVQIGKLVHFTIRFTGGSTSAMGTAPSVSLPISGSTGTSFFVSAMLLDNGVNRYNCFAEVYEGSVYVDTLNTAGTYLYLQTITSTVPFTFGSNDRFYINGTYEVA